jgi:hypothetical protein
MGKAWEEVVTIPNFSKNLNVNSSKVAGTWHQKTNSLDYLGFDLDGQDSVKFLIYTMMGLGNYIHE